MVPGLSALGAAVAALHGQPVPAGPMTMDQAVALAERNAFEVRLQKSTVERDRQAVFLALSALGPTLGLNPVYTHFGSETAISLGPGQAPIVVSPSWTLALNGSLNFPIDVSGDLHRLWGASQEQYEAAKLTLLASFNDARLSARSAYLTVLRDKALVDVAQETLKDAQGRLDQAKLEFQQQQIAKVDVDRLDAQVAQSNSDLLNAQNTLQLADYAFNLALALPIERPVELVDVSEQPPMPAQSEPLVSWAVQNRPESLSQNKQIKALKLIARAQEAGMDPSVALGFGYANSVNPGAFSSGTTGTFTFSLNVPVFDAGATRARVKEARQDVVAATIQLEQTQLGISQEVRNSFANLSSAEARLLNAQRQVSLAEEVFRLAKVRQDAGEGTYVEVIDAESSLATARNGLVSAKYDYFQAFSQLQHGLGTDKVALGASQTTNNIATQAQADTKAQGNS